MAATVGEKGTSLISTREADSILTQKKAEIQDGRISQPNPSVRRRRKWQFRSVGSRNTLMIIAWIFIIFCSQHSIDITETEKLSPWLGQLNSIMKLATFAISCPIASFLAEVFIGRYRFISFTLRVLWLLHSAGLGISLLEYCLHKDNTTLYLIGHYLLALPANIFQGAFLSVAISLGLDQIAGASNTNINAFVVWCVWAIFGGYSMAEMLQEILQQGSHLQAGEVSLIIILLPVILLSVALVLDFNFHHKLVKEPVTVNPVSLIFKVLKYAAKHKYPVQRSAFTYCENERPTRLDYGKSKYGGPFTTEQVEDVKTFWRMLVVIFVISMLFAPLVSLVNSYQEFEGPPNTIASRALSPLSFVAYLIPLYELLIYPCLRNRGPSILQSAGIGATAVVASSLYGLMTVAVREATQNDTPECMFKINAQNNSKDIKDFFIAIPFNFLLALAITLVYKTRIEFICAQAPYNMNSLLIGLALMLQTLLRAFGEYHYSAFSEGWFKGLQTSICGIWFYLTNLVMAILISVLVLFIVRQYKGRERDEITESQMLVEDIYYKYKR